MGLGRRSFIESLFAIPLELAVQSAGTSTGPAVKVAARADRFSDARKLPGEDLLYVKTQDTGGALFMTEQPIMHRGVGPPKHYHENQDEWFCCLAGEYVVEGGDRRFRLKPGDSVLGGRDASRTRSYMTAPAPGACRAGRMEQFFRDLERRREYFGNGTLEDRERASRESGIVNVGPLLKL